MVAREICVCYEICASVMRAPAGIAPVMIDSRSASVAWTSTGIFTTRGISSRRIMITPTVAGHRPISTLSPFALHMGQNREFMRQIGNCRQPAIRVDRTQRPDQQKPAVRVAASISCRQAKPSPSRCLLNAATMLPKARVGCWRWSGGRGRTAAISRCSTRPISRRARRRWFSSRLASPTDSAVTRSARIKRASRIRPACHCRKLNPASK
jgi:hypothetical protein